MDNYVANVIPHLQDWWPVIITLSYLVGAVAPSWCGLCDGVTRASGLKSEGQKQHFNRDILRTERRGRSGGQSCF